MRTLFLLSSFFLALAGFSYAQPSPTPASERLEGIARRKALANQSLVANLKFRNVGPTVMSGRVVERGKVKSQSQLKLSGSNWESGVYHVVLTLNNGTQKTMPWMLQK